MAITKSQKRRQFHSTAQAVPIHGGDRDAVRACKLAKNMVKRGQHGADAIRRVIGHFRARRKRFAAFAAEDQEITRASGGIQQFRKHARQ